MIIELINEHSLDPAQSGVNRATVMTIGEAIRQVVNENFKELRYPVIAGGAIRDTIFGLPIKDFDIFFDTSVFKDDEREDMALLLIAMVCEKLAEHEYPELRNCRFTAIGHNEGYPIGEGETRKIPFIVYENYPFVEPSLGLVNWEQGFLDVVPDDPVPDRGIYSFPTLQVIGHGDERLRTEPIGFLEYFDYDLVKGLFDPSDMNFHAHPDLLECLKSKDVKFNNDRTRDRVHNFFDKMFPFPNGVDVINSFNFVDTRPKEAPLADVPFDSYNAVKIQKVSMLELNQMYPKFMQPNDLVNINNLQWRVIDE